MAIFPTMIEVMEQPAAVVTAERPPNPEPASRREVITAYNQAAANFRLEAEVVNSRARRGATLTPEETQIQTDYRVFEESQRNIARRDGPLPENLNIDYRFINIEDPANPTGPGYSMRQGIAIEGLLRSVDRTIERDRRLGQDQAKLDRHLQIREILLDNSDNFAELYFLGLSEQDLRRNPKFYARNLYEARQWVWKHPEEAYDIGNWLAVEREKLLNTRELNLPGELESETPRPPLNYTRPVRENEPESVGEGPRYIDRRKSRIIYIAKPREGVAAEDTGRESGGLVGREERIMRARAERLVETQFGRSLRVDPRILLAILAAAGLAALLQGRQADRPTGDIYGPVTPNAETGPYRQESYTYGEPGNSLNGLAEAKATELSNADKVAAAKRRGEVYQPDLAAMAVARGGPSPADDPSFVNEADEARKLPHHGPFKDDFKASVQANTPVMKDDDTLPQTAIAGKTARDLWNAAKARTGGSK